MKHRRRFTAVESIIDIHDRNRVWYYIPGFNGYEVSNDGYIRSMKHYLRYPYGILISPVTREPYGSSCDPLFEISDDNNVRRRIRLSQLIHLAMTSNYRAAGYPRHTIITDPTSRNKYIKNENGAYVKVYNGNKPGGGRKSIFIPPMDNSVHYAKFTIIQDGNELPNMTYCEPMVIVPIEPIKGDEYYGRKDCRAISHLNVCRGPGKV